ncbi:MAG: hypothetical protein JZU62_04810 [Sulfuricurvum sp.]|uniref:hypothetical protein n=1 Tax=Sulfuricurvum sp. TaxID=2025608 RepID=UPI0025F09DBF|nr:hypothetical protein [Sulfuricurvum sp.]MBV5320984.1 hypothetical protein [Sulfuricurvum sp.]
MFLKPFLQWNSLLLSALMISGCTTATLPPHESLTNAMNKTFEISGYNYDSSTRITKMTIPKSDTNASETDSTRNSIYLQKGIDVIRGFSLGIAGAVDYSHAIKTESTYDFHYNRDNVEVSVKLPFLFDYSTKTLYMGKTFLNTIFPMDESDEGKFIRFDLNDTLISSALGEESLSQFDENKVRSINSAMKEGTLKAFTNLNPSLFTYVPLSPKEKFSGSVQKVHLTLDRNQSMTLILTITDALVQKMYTESMLTKEAYGSYMLFSDPKQLSTLTENMNLQLTFDFGITTEGQIALIQSQINASDKEEEFTLGIENITRLNSFNDPQFTLSPEHSGSVDYKETFQKWTELFPPEPAIDPLTDLTEISNLNDEQTR